MSKGVTVGMNKQCINCANQANCIKYNVIYGSKYCEIHKS